ncbi:class I SAM-dependent methyltransferase [soil metagenome]
MREHMEINRVRWDELVPIHARSDMYRVELFRSGGVALQSIELEELGDVSGKSLLHLQCHFGLDSLSWARLGAKVTSMDYSEPAIELARSLSAETGVEARFIHSNLYDLPDVLNEKFDIVFTSYGVLCWLPDIKAWAEIVARYLKPGGTFYIVEGHSFMWGFETNADKTRVEWTYPYCTGDEPLVFDAPGTYADEHAEVQNTVTHEWNHPLGEIVTSLIDSGLRIDFLHEHQVIPWKPFPFVVEAGGGYYKLPDDIPSLPLMFSIKATRV